MTPPPSTPTPRFRTVVFDCDSTLSAVEGIEELARARDVDVEALTEAAMRGEIPLEAVYGRRLELAQPTRAGVEALGRRYVETLVPGAREVVAALHAADVRVHIVSGGLLPAVRAVAQELGVPGERVHAVDVFFDGDAYHDFDHASPLARSGGKPMLLQTLEAQIERPVMLVGDGATDAEAAPHVDLFVAFAGVVDRPAVTQRAAVVIRERSLLPILDLVLGEAPLGVPRSGE